MRTDHASQTMQAQDLRRSTQLASASMNMPCTGPQDLDFMAAEHEALEAAGVPWAWRDALQKSLPATPEEGAPCPGGFGV